MFGEQSEQNNQPASNSQLQCTTGLEAQSTASPSSLKPSKPDSLSVSGSRSDLELLDSNQSPSVAAAPALRNSHEDDASEPVVPRVVVHVEARQFSGPDAQVGGAKAVQEQPGTALANQPNMGVQRQVPQHEILERDQACINAERNRYGRGRSHGPLTSRPGSVRRQAIIHDCTLS